MPTLPGTYGFPDMPEAENFLRAIRRLDFRSENDDPDLIGPPVDADVSGRSASAGGSLSRAPGSLPPSSSPSPRELGLLLDDELIDDLLLADWPAASIPVEMALGALTDAGLPAGPTAPGGSATQRGEDVRNLGFANRRDRQDRHVSSLFQATGLTRVPSKVSSHNSKGNALETPSVEKEDSGTIGPQWGMERPERHRRAGSGREERVQAPPFLTESAYATILKPAGALFAGLGGDLQELARFEKQVLAAHSAAPEIDAAEIDAAEIHAGAPLAFAHPATSVFRGLASLLFPGWGQSLNGQHGKAAAFRAVYLVTLTLAASLAWREPLMSLLSSFVPLDASQSVHLLGTALFAGSCVWLLSAYDAIVVASSRR